MCVRNFRASNHRAGGSGDNGGCTGDLRTHEVPWHLPESADCAISFHQTGRISLSLPPYASPSILLHMDLPPTPSLSSSFSHRRL